MRGPSPDGKKPPKQINPTLLHQLLKKNSQKMFDLDKQNVRLSDQ